MSLISVKYLTDYGAREYGKIIGGSGAVTSL